MISTQCFRCIAKSIGVYSKDIVYLLSREETIQAYSKGNRIKMKILNLYAGIGGNRKLWGDEHEVTAVENVPEIAAIYKEFFPNDKVIVGDAHKYLLEHYKEFDFIWSSPPCPTHSCIKLFNAIKEGIQVWLFIRKLYFYRVGLKVNGY